MSEVNKTTARRAVLDDMTESTSMLGALIERAQESPKNADLVIELKAIHQGLKTEIDRLYNELL